MVIFTEELTSDGRAPLFGVFGAYCGTGAAPVVDVERTSDGTPERGQGSVEDKHMLKVAGEKKDCQSKD